VFWICFLSVLLHLPLGSSSRSVDCDSEWPYFFFLIGETATRSSPKHTFDSQNTQLNPPIKKSLETFYYNSLQNGMYLEETSI
jgi:hypothetical protein